MKLIKDSIIYVGGEILSKIMPFLLIPYLSRKLGVEGYGELSYYQTFLALFAIIVSLSQDGAIARYFYVYGKRSLNLVLRSGYIYTSIIGIIIFAICALLQSTTLMFISFCAIFQSVIRVQLSIRQCQKQSLSYILIQTSLAILSVVITILLFEIYNANLINLRFIAILLANLLVFIGAFYFYKKQVNTQRKFNLKQYKIAFLYIVSFGLPLIFHHGSFFIKGQLDRFFIYHEYSEAQLGIYAMGANLAIVITTLILAVNKAVVPYYFEAIKKNKITLKNIHVMSLISFLLVPLFFMVSYFVPEKLFLWVLGEQFVGVKYYFTIFSISSLLTVPYLFLVNYLFYYGKTNYIAMCSIISTICYLLMLLGLLKVGVEYIPYASIFAAISILPVLLFMTKKVSQ